MVEIILLQKTNLLLEKPRGGNYTTTKAECSSSLVVPWSVKNSRSLTDLQSQRQEETELGKLACFTNKKLFWYHVK